MWSPTFSYFFFFNDTATTEIYTLSLHDALPISVARWLAVAPPIDQHPGQPDRDVEMPSQLEHRPSRQAFRHLDRSEEHTSELQSHLNLVCRLLLEKKKN